MFYLGVCFRVPNTSTEYWLSVSVQRIPIWKDEEKAAPNIPLDLVRINPKSHPLQSRVHRLVDRFCPMN